MHTHSHIWHTSHPWVVTYYCWVTVYSPNMKAKNKKNWVWTAGNRTTNTCHGPQPSDHSVNTTFESRGNFVLLSQTPTLQTTNKTKKISERERERERKNSVTPKITNHLFTYYLNCTCKFYPVCLSQQWSVIFLLASYVQWHYFLVWGAFENWTHWLFPIYVHCERAGSSVFHFFQWMSTVLYYDPDRFACVRIPTQIQIQHYNTNLNSHMHPSVHTSLGLYSRLTLSKMRSTTFARADQKRSKIGFLTAIKIKRNCNYLSLYPAGKNRWAKQTL